MILWIACTLLMIASVLVAARPLFLRSKLSGGSEGDVYQAQLREIAREESLGLTAPEDARMARIEIQRRLLGATQSPAPAKESDNMATKLSDRGAFITVAVILALGSVAIYGLIGQPLLPSAARGEARQMAETNDAGSPSGAASMSAPAVSEMIDRLETRLKTEPKDAEGWRMLGWSKFRTDDYSGAAAAYAEAVKLTPKDSETLSAWGEALARAANGLVTPEAEKALKAALKIDPDNPRSRFLLGLEKEQNGQAKLAIDDWIAMLKSAPTDADWYDDVRGRVVELAISSGIDVGARLPPPRSTTIDDLFNQMNLTARATPGPSDEDLQASQTLSPQDRQAMIVDMVARLDERLTRSPNDAEGWQRLIHARRVLQQDDLAQEAVRRARLAFPNDTAAIESFRKAASEPLDSLPN